MELNINIQEYLKQFRVHNPTSLFPPNFENLQKNLCPICGRKLYSNIQKTIYRCKSKQKDKFFIRTHTLLTLGGNTK